MPHSSPPTAASPSSPHTKPPSPSYWELCKAYNLHEHYCAAATAAQAQRAKCRPLPNCLHGLRHTRATIHTTPTPPLLRSLGADPALRLRPAGRLVGLTNLGATCYLNTLLQCLFMNSHFRHTLYLYRSPHPAASGGAQPGDAVVLLLQQLFGLMEYGVAAYESPDAIVRELNLKRHVQQDVNEFNNLLLSVLEGCLKECAGGGEAAERVRRLIASEFAGETVSTVRSECGHVSERPSSFHDVSLLIRGKKTLLDCLDAFTEAEELTAHNAYYCSQCHQKYAASKHTRFASLPPVLNLQLIRFHYDVDSAQRKKINDRIFLPYRLDMRPYMTEKAVAGGGDEGGGGWEYELTGVLRHKGASAHRGHYTCEVRDARGKWWIFDDDKVALGGDNFNARGDTASAYVRAEKEDEAKERDTSGEGAKGGKKKRKGNKQNSLTMKKRSRADKEEEAEANRHQHKMTDFMGPARNGRGEADDDDDDDVVMLDGGDERQSSANGEKSEKREEQKDAEDEVMEDKREVEGQRKGIDGDWSANAYMLVYTLRSRVQEDAKAAEEAHRRRASSPQQEERKTELNSHLPSSAVTPPSFICDCHSDCRPPPSVKKAIESSAARLNDDIRLFDSRRQQLLSKIDERKVQVEQLLDILDAPPVTQHTAAEYEQQHRHPNQLSPFRPTKRRRRQHVLVDEVEVELSDEDDVDAVAEPFNFVHVGWLQRWLNGQTERDWSDEMAERAVAEMRGRGAKAAVDGCDKSDAIVVDGEEDGGEKEARESPLPHEDSAVIILSDDDDEQRTSSPVPLLPSSASSSSRQPSASCPPSSSPNAHFDTDDPLWPGDIYDSCARLLCPHGKLDPHLHKQRLAKRISSAAWSVLVKENVSTVRERQQFLADAGLAQQSEGRHPVDLDDKSLCVQCVLDMQSESNQLTAQRGQYEAMVEGMKEFTSNIARSAVSFRSGPLSQTGMLLDREWYKQFSDQVRKWKAKAYSAVPLPNTSPEDVNKGLVCAHGQLRNRFEHYSLLLSPQLWKQFLDHYPNSTEFKVRTIPCHDCEQADEADLGKRNALATQLTGEQDKWRLGNLLRQRHDLFPDPKRPPHSNKGHTSYYLLPARWMLHKFLPFHEQAVVDSSKPLLPRPPPAPMADLFCEHHKLKLNPVPKGVLGGALDGIDKGEVTWCEASAWRGLVEGGYIEGDGDVRATMEIEDVVEDSSLYAAGPGDGWRSVITEFDPPPCEVCILAKQKIDHNRLHQFTSGSIAVRRVPVTTPIGSAPATAASSSPEHSASPSTSSASPTTRFAAPAPTSPRSRSRRKRAYTTLEEMTVYDVNCSDDVSTVKMKISQYCTHNPAHMRLFWLDRELAEGRRLSDYGVTDGGEVIMKVDAAAATGGWTADFTDFVGTDDVHAGNDFESGFAGTRLGGTEGNTAKVGVSPPASKAVVESKEEAEVEQRGSLIEPKLESGVAMEEFKQPPSDGGITRQGSTSSAPILPRLPSSFEASADTATPAPSSVSTVIAASITPTRKRSEFLTAIANSQRQKAQQPPTPAHAIALRNRDHSQSSDERKDPNTSPHDETDDAQLARQMQNSFDEEQSTARSKRVADRNEGGGGGEERALTSVRERRQRQEAEDLAFALKMQQQGRRGQTVVEGEGEGSDEDQFLDEEGGGGEAADDDDGDYDEKEDRAERKKRQAKPAARHKPPPASARTATSRAGNGSRKKQPAPKAGKKAGRRSDTESDADSEIEDSASDVDDEPGAQSQRRRPTQERKQQAQPVESRRYSQRTAASRADDAPTKSFATSYFNGPFSCVGCTFRNASGDRCIMCDSDRPREGASVA